MGDYKRYVGTLFPTNKSIKEFDPTVTSIDDFYSKYEGSCIIFDDEVYEVYKEKLPEDFAISFLNGDGTISYVVSYYTGCMCFEDAIEESLKD